MSIVGRTPTLLLKTEEATEKIASSLANACVNVFSGQSPISIWLVGDLGAGKTTFTRYFLRALGHLGKVKSPTYNLCEPYEIEHNATIMVHHFDLYRMNHPNEWQEAGFRDTLTSPGISLIEWPEKAEGTLPKPDLEIFLTMNTDETREISFTDHSEIGQIILSSLNF